MVDDWKDDFSTPVTNSSFAEGRSYGKGRGFAPPKQPDSTPLVGRSNDDWETGAASTNRNGTASNSMNDEWGTSNGASAAITTTNDEWGSSAVTSKKTNGNASNNDDWGTGGASTTQSNDDWGSGNAGGDEWTNGSSGQTFDDAEDSYHGGNRRGGGRGGGRGGRRDGDRRERNDGSDENRGRSRNRDREGLDDENTNDDGEEKKPPVTYIPPERSMDDADLFGSGVAAGINFANYDNIKVEVSGGDDIPLPIDKFAMAGLRLSLITNIEKSGYVKPTPVQKYAIPIMMNGLDVMACAQTGSGKTAAYLIPIIHNLLKDNDELHLKDRGCEPQVIVMAPTRELVTQICREAHKFAKDTVIKSIEVYGGVATMHQVRQVERGAHIIVATPGRLCDFVERGRIGFSKIRFMVLDEADRMLDQGFLSSMEKILDHETMVPKSERQTVMFSATFPSEVQSLAARFMRNYLFLRVGIVGGACENVEQNFYEVEKKAKRRKLEELLNLDGGIALTKKTLVFVETKKTADFIAAYMSDNNFPSTSIHGDREQREREIALSDFKSGRMPILVATSVAARGLDIPEVAHVINYDLPKNIDDYVHRIGRTGRMGNEGKATSFYDPNFDSALASDLVDMLNNANKEIPEFLQGISGEGFDGGKSSGFGGYDIRGDNDNGGGAAEPEEQW